MSEKPDILITLPMFHGSGGVSRPLPPTPLWKAEEQQVLLERLAPTCRIAAVRGVFNASMMNLYQTWNCYQSVELDTMM